MHTFYIQFINDRDVKLDALKYTQKDNVFIFYGDGGSVIATVPVEHVLYIGEANKIK